MKISLLLVCLLLTFSSCSKNQDPSIRITSEEWYLERVTGGALVHSKVAGVVYADSVIIKNFGSNGVRWQKIELFSKDHFNADAIVGYRDSSNTVPGEEFFGMTEVHAFKNSKTTIAFLSNILKF